MYFIGYHEYFETIADKQTRRIIITNDPQIPEGEYAILESICDDKTCDCRRMLLNICQINPKFPMTQVATISYGWEPLFFYKAQWGHIMPNEMIKDFKGPSLESNQKQSKYAPHVLELVKNLVLTDTAYINRLKQHYIQFKWRIGMKIPKDNKFTPDMPCPCESGSKFKFCCGRRGSQIIKL
jgi:hypothetical protein